MREYSPIYKRVPKEISQIDDLLGNDFHWCQQDQWHCLEREAGSSAFIADRGDYNCFVRVISGTDLRYLWKIYRKGSWTAPQKIIHESSETFPTMETAKKAAQRYARDNGY